MPRPRVLPENRVRAYRACDACKASKTRCDAHLPCASCCRKGRPRRCTYNAIPMGRKSRQRDSQRQSSHGHIPPLTPLARSSVPGDARRATLSEIQQVEHSGARPLLTQESTQSPPMSSPMSGGAASSLATNAEGPREDQESPREHFVPGVNGEKVYIGENTSLSFLDFLRHNVRVLVGTTSFTEGGRQNLMLEPDVDEVRAAGATPDVDEKRALFQSYLQVSSGILHLFTPEEAEELLECDASVHGGQLHAENMAAMDAALAIGAQARALEPNDAQYAAILFSRARQAAFRDMLANPSVAIVRLFLLLSFFTLGGCKQNAASIYLGIASKAAVVLGLHLPLSWKDSNHQGPSDSRIRIWHSLCILDVFTSSLLGRPCTVPRASRHKVESLPLHDGQPAFNANIRGAVILDDICIILSRGISIDVPTAQGLLGRLRQWCDGLAPSLRRFSWKDNALLRDAERKAVFGSSHTSGVYYFAVMLVTRPFLIESLMARLRQRPGSDGELQGDPTRASLAHVCISSATYMGHLCRQLNTLLSLSHLPCGSLSLFRAWAFGAGLVLGFTIFSGETRSDLNDAFSDVVNLLSNIGAVSPQASLYSDTLKAFAETIKVYQRLNSHKARRAADQYIEQILIIDTGGKDHWPPQSTSEANAFDSWVFPTPSTDAANLEEAGPDPHISDHWLNDQSWQTINVQLSDNYAMDFGTGLL